MKPDFLDMVPWYSGYVYKMLFFSFILLLFLYFKRMLEVILIVWLRLLTDAEHLLIYSKQFLISLYQ